jgi:hypothetical protein
MTLRTLFSYAHHINTPLEECVKALVRVFFVSLAIPLDETF